MSEGEHWSKGFQHESLAAPEARQEFTSAMSKYDSQEAAILGGFNAIKLTGKPYKLPESIDKLDEKTRSEFTANARKVLGIESVGKIEDLADLNIKDGLPENFPVNEDFANSFKKFVVDNQVSKAGAQKLVAFYNQAMAAVLQQQQAQKNDAAKTTNEAMIKHFGSEDKVKERSQLVKQFYMNHAGLSAEEFEQVGQEIDAMITRNPILARVHLDKIAALAGEGSTESGKGAGGSEKPSMAQRTVEENPATAKALGW
jgi:hypothetical protein